MSTSEQSSNFVADPNRVFKVIAEIMSGREKVKVVLRSVSRKEGQAIET